MSFWPRHAQELEALGYEAIPILPHDCGHKSAGKAPAIRDWQNGFDPENFRLIWRLNGGVNDCGIGILTRNTPALDIDVRHPVAAAELQKLAYDMFPNAPERVGMAPKRLFLFRTDEPFTKLKTREYLIGDDNKPHHVEILGDGQQFVAFGIHPGTGRPYHWIDDSPLDIEAEALPEITKARAFDFIAASEQILSRYGKIYGSTFASDGEGRVSPHGLRGDRKLVESAIAAIPNDDVDYYSWVKIGYSIKGALGEDGLDLFFGWSAMSTKHDDKETESFWKNAKPHSTGAGSIYYIAGQHGWKRPAGPGKPTAALPEFYQRPSGDRENTLELQRQAITGFLDRAVTRFDCLRDAAIQRSEAHATIATDMGVTEFSDPDELARFTAAKARASRRINVETARRYGFDRLPKDAPKELFTGGQGTGKTRTALEALARQATDAVTVYLAPTREKAAEAKRDYDRAKPSRPSILIRGRSAEVSDDETMCRRARVVEKAAKMGVKVGKEICPTCPFNKSCAYLKQAKQIEEYREAGGFVAFAASAYVYLPSPVEKADIVIVDEDVTMKAAQVKHFAPERLTDPGIWRDENPAITAELLVDARSIRDALTKHPGNELAELGVDSDRLAEMIRHLHESQPLVPNVTGSMSDSEIERQVDEIENREAGKVLRFLSTLRRELRTGRKGAIAATFDPARRVMVDGEPEEHPRLVVHSLRKPDRWMSGASLLMLDGTGSRDLAARIFGEDLIERRFAVERRMTVNQVAGKSFSKSSLLGTGKSGAAISDKGLREAERLRGEIGDFVGKLPGKVFVASTKAVEDAMPVKTMQGHFGDLRGKNAFEDCSTAVVVGREQPSPAAVEEIARCFAMDRIEPLMTVEQFIPCTRRRRMRDPEAVEVETVEVHPDPLAQSILEQIREAEVAQALDRVRGVFNERSAWVLNRLVLDVTVDTVQSWKAARNGWRGGSRWTEAQERGRELGVMPLSPAELSRLWPDLWATKKAAERELQKADGVNTPNANRDLISEKGTFSPARYWTREKQFKPFRAAVRSDLSDEQITAILGTVLRIDVERPVEPEAEMTPEAHFKATFARWDDEEVEAEHDEWFFTGVLPDRPPPDWRVFA